MQLTADYLRSRLDYDSDTGVFLWRLIEEFKWSHRSWNTRFAGERAGSISRPLNRRLIALNRVRYLSYRLAWLHTYGVWPIDVDHVNGDSLDDRLCNLREATDAQNLWNRGAQANCSSGLKGAYLDARTGRYTSRIKAEGEDRYLGSFKTPEEAHAAYCEAAARLHGAFARFG